MKGTDLLLRLRLLGGGKGDRGRTRDGRGKKEGSEEGKTKGGRRKGAMKEK